MDFRTSAIVALGAWAFAATIAAVGVVGFYAYRDKDVADSSTSLAADSRKTGSPQTALRVAQSEYRKARARASQLEDLLKSANTASEQQRIAMGKLRNTNARIRQDLKKSMELVQLAEELLDLQASEDPKPEKKDPADPAPAAASTNLQEQIAELSRQIASRDEVLEAIEVTTEQELAQLTAQMRQFRAELQRRIAEIGPQSLDVLTELLVHENPEIRVWSANTLGLMGDDAADALSSLREHANDRDPQARNAIRSAIRAIVE